jgi:hypothetical protein
MAELVTVFESMIKLVGIARDGLPKSDIPIFEAFLVDLTDYGVLTQPFDAEYAGAAIESVERLRKLVVEIAKKLSPRLRDPFLTLGTAAREFLTRVDAIDRSIRRFLDPIEKNRKAKVQLDDHEIELLEHWKSLDYPDRVLRRNYRLNITEMQGPNQYDFLIALGAFREAYKIILGGLCSATATELPPPLASLTPGLEEL